ncbi:hypothetical protein P3X46_000685 [Hevea brasiliensis]|uniref:BZIP domain-containing protein n=1 Tax=Hevea brasiliensis TaxID=3981 RepID=A0ABQ9NCP3_HEVBR|nr:bZIP transcription factor 12 isoform X1 [Hevea brasiliensis]KAJ9189381.1 hypothetical protein P3X46_000685 [Hevea brasiliensis]
MALSKVMATSSTTNPDPPRQPSLCSSLSIPLADLQNQNQNQNQFSSSQSRLLSVTMDDLLKNIYSYPTQLTPNDLHVPSFSSGASISRDGGFPLLKEAASKSVDEVWKEIVAGGDQRREGNCGGGGGGIEGMTLEDFLTKAGAVREEDVRGVGVPVQVGAAVGAYGVDSNSKITNDNNNYDNGEFQGAGNGMMMVAEGGKGRQKRRAVEEPPMDKATQQKQRRMIKNRESAARSRERKQAYTVELESLVTQLEEENSRLLREEVEQKKKRFKELMENLIPVVEKRRPPHVLRRVNSVQW